MGSYDEITKAYFELLDQHLNELVNGDVLEMLELSQIAEKLNIPHKRLITVIQSIYGNHPCHFYDQRILEKAKDLLRDSDWPVAKIALRLTYDPSNFSKFFKKYTGQTPGQYRSQAQ
ncbi:Helix-turn-helix domain-containing protein [bacterium A37T11]|nr:Helix-turn-helix domain-containing protein [bacterium A37T11]